MAYVLLGGQERAHMAQFTGGALHCCLMRRSREFTHGSSFSLSSLSGVFSRCSAAVAALGAGFTHTAVNGRAHSPTPSSSSSGAEALASGLCIGAFRKLLMAALSRSCSAPHHRNHIWSP
jgi:hypothetical protein